MTKHSWANLSVGIAALMCTTALLTAKLSAQQPVADHSVAPTFEPRAAFRVDGEEMVVSSRLLETARMPFENLPRLGRVSQQQPPQSGDRPGNFMGNFPIDTFFPGGVSPGGYFPGNTDVHNRIRNMSALQLQGGRPGRDFTPDQELDTATILQRVQELESEPSTAQRMRKLIDMDKGIDNLSMARIRREYAASATHKLIVELRRRLTAPQPQSAEMVEFLRRHFRNRTVDEMEFFASEYAAYLPGSARHGLFGGSVPSHGQADLYSDLRSYFVEGPDQRSISQLCLYAEADWLIRGFEVASTCAFIRDALAVLHEDGERSSRPDAQELRAALADHILDILESLSKENRIACDNTWERTNGTSLKSTVHSAVKFSVGNVDRLERLWNDHSAKDLAPLVKELFPTDDARWGTQPSKAWRPESHADLSGNGASPESSAESRDQQARKAVEELHGLLDIY